VSSFGPSQLAFFFVLTAFAGLVVDLASKSFSSGLFEMLVKVNRKANRNRFEEQTKTLRTVAKQEATIDALVNPKNEYDVWPIAAKFLREVNQPGQPPVENYDRSVSYALVGIASIVAGILSLGLDLSRKACASNYPCEFLDVVIFPLGALLLLGAKSESDEFTSSTLAGLRQMIRSMREAEASRAEASKMLTPEQDTLRINQLGADIDRVISHSGSEAGTRVYDSYFLAQLFQERKNVSILSIDALREKAIKALDRIGSETQQAARGNLLRALAQILLGTEDPKVYQAFESHYASPLAGLAIPILSPGELNPSVNQYYEPVRYMESSELARTLLQVAGDMTAGSAISQSTLDAVSNSHLGDCNQELIREFLEKFARERPGFAENTYNSIAVLTRRRELTPQNLDNIPTIVRIGKVPRNGITRTSIGGSIHAEGKLNSMKNEGTE
jgi:hypothetical protein